MRHQRRPPPLNPPRSPFAKGEANPSNGLGQPAVLKVVPLGPGRATFATDFTRQDAAILNIQRACEAALDMGQHLIRREKLGVPQSARDVFALLAHGGWIGAVLADSLKRMVGFRNIAVHNYQSLQLPIAVAIIETHLDEFLQYSQALLLRDAAQPHT